MKFVKKHSLHVFFNHNLQYNSKVKAAAGIRNIPLYMQVLRNTFVQKYPETFFPVLAAKNSRNSSYKKYIIDRAHSTAYKRVNSINMNISP